VKQPEDTKTQELDLECDHLAELDFDSDTPLPECPLRNQGDDVCESCQ
jgi:hypothetical protein